MKHLELAPIPRRSTVEQVADQIREVIETHRLGPGDRLPGELELVSQLRVSRPVLREALARLQSVGLVDIRRGRGTFVGGRASLVNCTQFVRSAVAVSPRELLTYAELRTAIEVQSARQAALRATPNQIEELRSLLIELDDSSRPYAEYLELDFRFHRKIVAAAGNELMQNLMEIIYEFVLAQMAQTTPSPKENALGRTLHQQLVDAIADHNPDAAEAAMRVHMDAVLERLARIVGT